MIDKKIKNEKDCIDYIVEVCEKNKHTEICGFVGYNGDSVVVRQCENIADDKVNHFAVSPVDYLLFQEDNDFLFLFHSHISGDEKPSEFDVVMSENCCLPFFIYSLNNKKSNIYMPKKHEVDVLMINRFKEYV